MNEIIRLPGSSGQWHDLFSVPSDSRKGVQYVVGKNRRDQWGCSCPQWVYTTPRQDCKHIRRVKDQLVRNTQVVTMTTAQVDAIPSLKKALSRFSFVEV